MPEYEFKIYTQLENPDEVNRIRKVIEQETSGKVVSSRQIERPADEIRLHISRAWNLTQDLSKQERRRIIRRFKDLIYDLENLDYENIIPFESGNNNGNDEPNPPTPAA